MRSTAFHRPTALDRVLPGARLTEVQSVELALPIDEAWEATRHLDLSRSRLVAALFTARTLPARLLRRGEEPSAAVTLGIDDLGSTPDEPGFQILVDEPPSEVVVGAIGQVWQLDIPFVHVADADAFAAYDEPDQVKVAWALQVDALDAESARVSVEVRVDATTDEAWDRFRRYFRRIGPGSRIVRRTMLRRLARDHGTPAARALTLPLPGDDFLADADAELTHSVTIQARPDEVWPWLVQMGSRRAGFYSLDLFDNAGRPSARELHPEWQELRVGDVIPATPTGHDGFEVLALEEHRWLVLGSLFDAAAKRQLRFTAPRPDRYWQMTWAFVLEPLADGSTRLTVRVQGAFPTRGRLHAAWIRPAHHLMQTTQLRHLAARAEGRAGDEAADMAAGLRGAARMAANLFTPFRRDDRRRWGLDAATAERSYPGDELVPSPSWDWTHGIEIDAAIGTVWPWVAQIGADRAGFYSYQWLENVVGCGVRNAERIHPEWAVAEGDALLMHPDLPPLPVAAVEPGRWYVAHGAPDPDAEAGAAVSWLFFLEPLGDHRCRFISRYRCATSDDLATRLQFGPAVVEPIGSAMDIEMLKGVRDRAEAARAEGGSGP